MDIMKTYLALLIIFCIIGSAAAVCAADVGDNFDAQALGQSNDFDGGWAGSQYNATLENATTAIDATNAINTTNVTNATNATDVTANTTAPVVANSTNSTNSTVPHNMLATGNPILLLLGVSAVLGGYTVLRKKD
ncbi:MAG: hypothetical protein E7Z77_05890 [Methanobrevibacter sp.]|uniref:hypothetical protein n=1 Tax=Methanobrevibacter sp. TaxID=66852 RepID=UPI0025F7B3DA|nr:hypothetical protein [Methanobrevibacter sp.]MBE6508932.1 hypothetical protein [Methanobrevibacter sp.]